MNPPLTSVTEVQFRDVGCVVPEGNASPEFDQARCNVMLWRFFVSGWWTALSQSNTALSQSKELAEAETDRLREKRRSLGLDPDDLG
jgi:hypothetical protein